MAARCADCALEDVVVALQEAEMLIAQRGGESTALRRKILKLLLEAKHPTKAYDLLNMLNATGRAKPPTVYRTLDFLREMGLVHRIESLQAFAICKHWKHEHAAVFLLCDACGTVEELDAAETLRKLKQSAAVVMFKTRDAIIEVHGMCMRCR